MDHLDRPVFEFPVNWAETPRKVFSYDLRELQLGYGSEIFTSLQSHAVQGFQFSLDLQTDEAINAFDEFFNALNGRLTGFWLPAFFETVQIVAMINGAQFTVRDMHLAETWQDHPSVHLYFSRDGYTSRAEKVVAVLDLGNGLERITLDNELPEAALLSPHASVCKLLYVRLLSDVEDGRFVAEGWQKRNVRVVELPTEYTTIETGEKKIFLFHFWCAAPMDYHWRYTNFAGDVVSQNKLFSKFPMDFGALHAGMKGDDDGLRLKAAYDATHPLALFLPLPFSRPMNVEVIETTYADPDTATVLFTGRVRSVEDRGEFIEAQCDGLAALLGRKTPRMLFQKECNNTVYDPQTCRAVRAHFETSAVFHTVASTSATVVVTLDFESDDRKTGNWFAQGFLETGIGLEFEVRTILSSTWDAGTSRLTLKLNAPLFHAAPGDAAQLIPGCDGTFAACDGKFKNKFNFGGFVDIPTDNLSLKAVEAKVSAGGKK